MINSGVVKKNCSENFLELLNMNLKSTFEEYIESNQYQYDLKKIADKEGDCIVPLVKFISNNFASYFSIAKGNKCHLKKFKSFKSFRVKSNQYCNKNENEIKNLCFETQTTKEERYCFTHNIKFYDIGKSSI